MMITVNLNVCFPWIASWNEVSMLHLFCNHISCFWNTGTLLSGPSEFCSQSCSGLLGQTPQGGMNGSAAKPTSPFGQAPSGLHTASLPALPPSPSFLLTSFSNLLPALLFPFPIHPSTHPFVHPSTLSLRCFWRPVLHTSPAPRGSGIAMKKKQAVLGKLKISVSPSLSLSVHLLLFLSWLSISKIRLDQIGILSY